MHADLRIGDSHIMLHDAMMGGKGPKAMGGSPASLWIYVDDADALFNRAVAAGAGVAGGSMGQMADQFWGDRCGTLTDPHGYSWTIGLRPPVRRRLPVEKPAARADTRQFGLERVKTNE